MLYAYQKSSQDNPSPGQIIPNKIRFLPTLISAIGLGLITSVLWPILSYHLTQTNLVNSETPLLSPAYYQSFAESTPSDHSTSSVINHIDYTKAGNWFPATLSAPTFINTNPALPDFYIISIPSLKIDQAIVSLTNENLETNLVHYPQTALPGQKGSPVIFGHSTLPQFFDPSNYTSIFSILPSLKSGANIFITYDGVKYTYKVTRSYEVKPDDTWVLRQEYDQRTLKLVTCVPPGTKLKRLIVEANIINL